MAAVLLVLLIAVALYLTKEFVKFLVVWYYAHKLPGPPVEKILLGNLSRLMTTQDRAFKVFREWGSKYHPIYKIWIGHMIVTNVTTPEDAGLVLGETKHNEKGLTYWVLKRWLQNGLLVSHGEKWAQRRKILTPAFHFTILQDFLQVFNERTQDLVQRLKQEVVKPYTEINEIITNCTLKIIGETAMGQKMSFSSSKTRAYEKALHRFGTVMMRRLMSGYLIYDCFFFFTKSFLEELRLVKTMHEYTQDVIKEQETVFQAKNIDNKKKPLALLDLLLANKSQGVIDDRGIREEVDTFMFEGHDTISSAIIFGLMIIANHPKIQEKIVQEMREVLGDIKKKPTYEELQKLKYMEMCLKESLRLYPSVPVISRVLSDDVVTYSGYKLKKGTFYLIHIFDIHYNSDIYPDPGKFDPDRFLPENCKNRHPYAHIPFSAGPRNCIGKRFAYLELKALFCGILGNFVLEPVDTPETIEMIVDFILRSKENVKIKFVTRNE